MGDERLETILRLSRETLKAIYKKKIDYLSEDGGYFKRLLNFEINHLDFRTGHLLDGSEKFLRPLSLDEVNELLSKTKPWEGESPIDPITEIYPLLDNLWMARFIQITIERYLTNNKDGRLPGAINSTGWEGRSGMRTKYRYRIEETYEFWKIEQFLIRKSTSLPHINGLVVDNSPMRDMDPLASEIQSILVLTHESLLNEEYRHHRVIPVTLITGSGTQIRITHGNVDVEEGRMSLWMTPIIDLVADEKEKKDDLLRVLGWVVGEPVGNTI
ncbi:hypothetical protein F4806DRAFT_401695 [Annulohypoxylon nitens]|nr:hypothetical protein F4806DRAFT_401695 [Annulohypoxylon nitens]